MSNIIEWLAKITALHDLAWCGNIIKKNKNLPYFETEYNVQTHKIKILNPNRNELITQTLAFFKKLKNIKKIHTCLYWWIKKFK